MTDAPRPPSTSVKGAIPKFVRVVLGIVVVILGGIVLVTLYGLSIPSTWTRPMETTLAASPATVFAKMTDYAGMAAWRKGTDSVRLVEPINDHETYAEDWGGMLIAYEVTAKEPPTHLHLIMHESSGAFEGEWDFVLVPAGSGTKLTMTETGTVNNPTARGVATLAFGGLNYCQKVYLKELDASLK